MESNGDLGGFRAAPGQPTTATARGAAPVSAMGVPEKGICLNGCVIFDLYTNGVVKLVRLSLYSKKSHEMI